MENMWQKDLGKRRNEKKERRRKIMKAERRERTQEKGAQKTRRWGG